jgi:hypothetical protein
MLLAVAAAASIAAAPTVLAGQSCTNLGANRTICQSPGNVQINDSPPVQYAPQYPYLGGPIFHHGGHHGRGGHR